MPQKPWPPDVIRSPLKKTSMSSQWLNACRLLAAADEIAQGLVGEHDAPAERVVGPVAFDDDDAVRRVLLLHQQGAIQAGGTAADADDVHASLNLKRCSLPVSVRGSLSVKRTARGYL